MITLNRELEIKLRNLPVAGKIILGFSFAFTFCMYGYILYWLFGNHLTDLAFFEVNKCPACYGESYCMKFKQGRSSLSGWSKSRWLDFTNIKNVHFAKTGRNTVVLKKLASSKEYPQLDATICKLAKAGNACKVGKLVEKLKIIEDFLIETHEVKDLSKSLKCPSQRLIDMFTTNYKETNRETAMSLKEFAYFLTTYLINPEPLIIQAFPPNEGWPFPKYLGACGRYVVEEYVGEPLNTYYSAMWEERIDLAYQILKIADLLTDNKSGFSFYMTRVDYDTFAVNAEGKIIVTDLDKMLIVDKHALKRQGILDVEKEYHSTYDNCQFNDCLNFDSDALCSTNKADHNIYAVCRNILSSYGKTKAMPGGLLHGLPSHIDSKYFLNNLLDQCAKPTKNENRFIIKDKLLKILHDLHLQYF